MVASDTEIRGGDAIVAGLSCGGIPRGAGGDGIREGGGRVVLVDRCVVAGGAGSRSAMGYLCTAAGVGFVGNVAASPDVTIDGLTARIPAPPTLAMPPTARAGASMSATFAHTAGATYWLFIDLVPAVYATPLFDVPLLLGPGLQFVATVTVSGTSASLPLGVPMIPLLIGRSLFFQAAAISPTGPDLRVSNPAAVLIQ